MRELRQYAEPALKIICLIVAVFVLWQLVGSVIRWNPFHGMTVPELPSLAASTNSPAGAGGRGTNLTAAAMVKGTNSAPQPAETNLAPSVVAANTNSISSPMPTEKGTNAAAPAELVKTEASRPTNAVAHSEIKLGGTNFITATNLAANGTNLSISTNAAGTNVVLLAKPEKKSANAAPAPEMAGMNSNPFAPPGKRGGDLPPAVQARISRITDSEILGPVMRPLPMGLLGIAGDCAFLRSASGQTGLVKEGDSLGDLKLLRIGINRVLVEQNGQQQELMIFSGYGGDSLLPKQKDTPDENKHP
jgi:hypothetical protein